MHGATIKNMLYSFLWGNSPASEFYMAMFRDTVRSIFIGGAGMKGTPMKMELAVFQNAGI